MRKIICDRCGKEIFTDRIGYVAVNWRARSDDSLIQVNPYENCDFCENCMSSIQVIIALKSMAAVDAAVDAEPEAVEVTVVGVPEAVEEEPETGEEAVEEEPVVQIQKTAVRKSVDKGKVGALAAAGWNTKKIADEMGVSPERIRQILKELEEKK